MAMKQFLLGLMLVCFGTVAVAQPKLDVTLANNSSEVLLDYMVSIPLKSIQSKIKGFQVGEFMVKDGSREVELQSVNDKGVEVVIFPVDLKSKEVKKVTMMVKSERFTYPKRTYAEIVRKEGGKFVNRKYQGGEWIRTNYIRVPDEHTDHSFDIKYEGPGWESDRIGYRFYLDWRNATDLYGKRVSGMVLEQVGVDGFDSYHELSSWGMDILKVGTSLGLGTIAYWDGLKANRVAKTDSVISKIAADGMLQSKVETSYFGWEEAGKKQNLYSTITIDAGSRASRQLLKVDSDLANFCTGIIKDKNATFFESTGKSGWGYIASWGKQSLNKDNMGLAILFKNADLIKVTEDKDSHVVVLKPIKGSVEYYFLGAWELEKDAIKSREQFESYLKNFQVVLERPVKVTIN